MTSEVSQVEADSKALIEAQRIADLKLSLACKPIGAAQLFEEPEPPDGGPSNGGN